MLSITRYGPESGVPLLIVHGLFGSARNWGVIAKRLSDERPVIAVDLRNHGESFHDERHDYPSMAGDLAEVIESVGGQADVLGHSMGGKASMVLALTRPALVRRLIVADIAPVTYEHTQLPLLIAMRDLDLTDLGSRSDADRRLSATVSSPSVRAFLLQSLDVRSQRWHLNLSALEAGMDDVLSFPDIDGSFDHPVMFVSGAESHYVQPEHRDRIKQLFPEAVFVRIPGAGHWLHAEKPLEFEAAVRVYLQRTGA